MDFVKDTHPIVDLAKKVKDWAKKNEDGTPKFRELSEDECPVQVAKLETDVTFADLCEQFGETATATAVSEDASAIADDILDGDDETEDVEDVDLDDIDDQLEDVEDVDLEDIDDELED